MKIFEEYLPTLLEKEKYYVAKRVYYPDIIVSKKNSFGATAKSEGHTQILYSVKDLIDVYNKKTYDGDNIQGLIGERLLSLVLESFLDTIIIENPESKILSSGVLREKDKHIGKGFIACYNDNYLLRHKDQFNFIILEKSENIKPEEMYMQEKYGLMSTEIDGLGFLHTENKNYLIVGESTTKKKIFSINSFNDANHSKNYEERVFKPLKSLFPNHDIIYLVMAPEEQLYTLDKQSLIVKERPLNIYKKLHKINIESLFIPMPKTKPTLDEMVNDFVDHILLAKELLYNAL